MSLQAPLDLNDRIRLVKFVASEQTPESAAEKLHMSPDGVARALLGRKLQAASREVIARALAETV